MNSENIVAKLSDKGFMFIASQSESEVRGILDCLGEVIYVTDVKVNPNSRALVTSSKALDFHTDHHKAKWVLWHCIEQTDDGGESILVDAISVYNQLSEAEKQALSQVMLFEHNIFEDDEDFCPVVTQENGMLKFYYSFWMADKKLQGAPKSAFMAFRAAITKETPVEMKLKKGDVLIIDNHRILHGRREIRGNQNRFLKRFWINVNKHKGEQS